MTFLTKGAALAAVLVLSGTIAGAQTQITSREALTGATTITWDAAGAAVTSVTNPFTITTSLGDVTTSSTGSIERRDAGTSWGGGFTSGDNLLRASTSDNLTFHFASPVTGFATQLWNDFGGSYTPTISLFNQGTFLATFSVVGSGGGAPNNNQAPVLGATYANGFDQVVINSSSPDFAINQLTVVGGVTTTPEPSSLALLGTGLVGLVPMIRRRRR